MARISDLKIWLRLTVAIYLMLAVAGTALPAIAWRNSLRSWAGRQISGWVSVLRATGIVLESTICAGLMRQPSSCHLNHYSGRSATSI